MNSPFDPEPYMAPSLDAGEEETALALITQKLCSHGGEERKPSELLKDSLVRALVLLHDQKVDGLVAGATRPTAEVVKAALHLIGPKRGTRFVAGHFFIESTDRRTQEGGPFLFADCAVTPEPSAHALALIAKEAAHSYRFFTGGVPKLAFLSFSTRGSASHATVDRIREALAFLKKEAPDVAADGELQVDAALDLETGRMKGLNESLVAGRANVLVFPTLEAGNIGYKLVQRFSKVRIAGPLLWGLNRPMSDLSRGCSVQEILDTAHCVSFMAQRMN